MRRSIAHNAGGILRNMEPYKIPEDKHRYIKDAKLIIYAHKLTKYFSLASLISSLVLIVAIYYFRIHVPGYIAGAIIGLHILATYTEYTVWNNLIARVAGQYSVTW